MLTGRIYQKAVSVWKTCLCVFILALYVIRMNLIRKAMRRLVWLCTGHIFHKGVFHLEINRLMWVHMVQYVISPFSVLESDEKDNIHSGPICHTDVFFLKGDAQAGLVLH